MKFEHTHVYNFENAFRGMRNPLESWNKNCTIEFDSRIPKVPLDSPIFESSQLTAPDTDIYQRVYIGKNDLELAQKLIRAGSEHRKFMRQIFVTVDITAPLYWWREMDTYKVGTTANSASTMHTIHKKPITLENFETDDLYTNEDISKYIEVTIVFLNDLREKYLETGDKKYWKELIRWLPNAWLQTRTITMTYENLLAICSKGQRRYHKLSEWAVSFVNNWARTLPYAQELIFLDEESQTDSTPKMQANQPAP